MQSNLIDRDSKKEIYNKALNNLKEKEKNYEKSTTVERGSGVHEGASRSEIREQDRKLRLYIEEAIRAIDKSREGEHNEKGYLSQAKVAQLLRVGEETPETLSSSPLDKYDTYEEYSEAYDAARKEKDEAFNNWFDQHKENYKLKQPILRKVKVDWSKDPKDMSRAERNNAILDMMRGVLTAPYTAKLLFQPQGYQAHKTASRLLSVLRQCTTEKLNNLLKDAGIKVKDEAHPAETLDTLSFEQLDALKESLDGKMNILMPSTQLYYQQQNMVGIDMVGIYATSNVGHSLFQKLPDLKIPYKINFLGHEAQSLSKIKSFDGEYISKYIGGYGGASTDSAKDPILMELLQSKKTSPTTMLMLQLGFNPKEIGLFFNQPIIQEVIALTQEGVDYQQSIGQAIAQVKEDWDIDEDSDEYTQITEKDLLNYIIRGNDLMEKEGTHVTTDKSQEAQKYINDQCALLQLLEELQPFARALTTLTMGMRAGTTHGAAGKSIEHTLENQASAEAVLDMAKEEEKYNQAKTKNQGANVAPPALLGVDHAYTKMDLDDMGDTDKLRENLRKSPIASENAFAMCGLTGTAKLLREYFLNYDLLVRDIISDIQNMSYRELDDKTRSTLINEFVMYVMTRTSTFGASKEANTTAMQTRKAFVQKYPAELEKFKAEHPELAESNPLLKRLLTGVFKTGKAKGLQYLYILDVGNLSSDEREDISRGWADLLHDKDPGVQAVALNLFRYAFFRTGFGFSPMSFMHLCPVEVQHAVPEYVETLRSLKDDLKQAREAASKAEGKESATSTDEFRCFAKQWAFNHLGEGLVERPIPSTCKFGAAVVSKADRDERGSFSKEFSPFNYDGSTVESFRFDCSKISKKAQNVFVTNVYSVEGVKHYEVHPIIAFTQNGQTVYYMQHVDSQSSGGSIIYYDRIEPLGQSKQFLEYEWGSPAEGMKSVLDQSERDSTDDDAVNAQQHDAPVSANRVNKTGGPSRMHKPTAQAAQQGQNTQQTQNMRQNQAAQGQQNAQQTTRKRKIRSIKDKSTGNITQNTTQIRKTDADGKPIC